VLSPKSVLDCLEEPELGTFKVGFQFRVWIAESDG